ncbi:MAG: 2,3,4,5-tetrahydropyridine-2,6-dicarboxylate N-succinyltransferase [Bacteroidia bacterium]|nr:2,3,4,5-tetrahydropyridine-2,6-dicarboxylate N-succinyltransferase [Bacteroidia bacterium]MDW8015761.1 2,3,4,5-tetrahydropyridine-2,6-dicarboxylate N-succinyltransferase [Bacteroidia bacterium]
MASLQELIEAAWEEPQRLSERLYREAVEGAIAELDEGRLRCAVPLPDGSWQPIPWVKQAILLYFRLREAQPIQAGELRFKDKIPPKRSYPPGVRVVPPGVARYGSYLAPGVILMPGYVNIGAYVGEGTMIDTWATVGSCAQIGRGVHLSGGVGIGGVLEPPQAHPVIVEDGAFIGSRAIIVEGVRVGERAIVGAGTILTASTPVIDVTGEEPQIYRGFVPPRAVVVSGMREKQFPAGNYYLPCALIIGWRDYRHEERLALNALLRDMDVPL